MDTLTNSWVEATKRAVESLQKKYQINRGMILTEGDLECHLFSELLQQKCLSGFHPSKDDTFRHNGIKGSELKTTYVHSQVTWFKPEKKSGYEVDITICEPKKLEVVNIELFEEYTSKGFAYDGPCVAIELKFVRDSRYPKQYDEDYFALKDGLIPDKLYNIKQGTYKDSRPDNIAFITIVGSKKREEFDKAKLYLGKHLSDVKNPCPENLFVCVFYQDEVIWNKELIIEFKASQQAVKSSTDINN